ncbi:response regulator transcription factor [Arcobacter sp. FWKO B]|uniref:response regulator transcription factor n=1 Tax=Arcobacter sp. FWKO B TaxID=2593672 RepID=UPI0018A55162|nr:response regulator transcription factor [Arcobacter sp. FWKO B]QOG11473.1 response regulator transcription factor [Arcobacter sp. FWKO B]
MVKLNILLLEDDSLFADSLIDFLNESDFDIHLAVNVEEALSLSYKKNYDLYIFDINLPDGNGLNLLKNLRTSDDKTPTIFLTSYKDKETIYEGFSCGCDDFLKKPVDLDELLFRIDAILKRVGKTKEKIKIGSDFEYDLYTKTLLNNTQIVPLTQKTSTLLEILVQARGTIVTKEMIISKLWSIEEEYSEGSIRVYINQLKKILGNDIIKNQKGIGYIFEN